MCNFDENPEPWPCYDLVQKRFAGPEMVFCYQNCSYLLWEKNCSSDWEKSLKLEAEGQELAKFLRSLDQAVKGQNNFW